MTGENLKEFKDYSMGLTSLLRGLDKEIPSNSPRIASSELHDALHDRLKDYLAPAKFDGLSDDENSKALESIRKLFAGSARSLSASTFDGGKVAEISGKGFSPDL